MILDAQLLVLVFVAIKCVMEQHIALMALMKKTAVRNNIHSVIVIVLHIFKYCRHVEGQETNYFVKLRVFLSFTVCSLVLKVGQTF